MKTISRDHNYTGRINYVRQGRKYYYFSGEKHSGQFRAPRTPGRDAAFASQNWEAFEVDGVNADRYRSDVVFIQGA